MAKLYLVFGIHNHQPVGNFDQVIEHAYSKCYLPFLQVLKDFQKVKCVVHFRGCLFDWLETNGKQEIFDILQDLNHRKQIEFLSSGYYEPILSIIPWKDKINQIKKMNSFIKDRFKVSPEGIWLTERIWQPDTASVVNNGDLKFSLLDDAHFRCSGMLDKEIFGYYTTENNGESIDIFPISKTLRYKVPFSMLNELEGILRGFYSRDKDTLVTLVDDGEKFGMWPHTYDWVYNKSWLKNFFEFIESNSDWIETITFKEAREKFSSSGVVYVPTASYSEMMEWVLEPGAHQIYDNLKKKVSQEYPTGLDFVRGGFFNNFFRKYPRINYMHKKMYYLSKKTYDSCDIKADQDVYESLWKSQCNCAYWHGVFGGFYLGHLRDAVYKNLIDTQSKLFSKSKDDFVVDYSDFDFDGCKELVSENDKLILVLSEKGGSIKEISSKKFKINLVNTITRREENYHKDIKHSVHEDSADVPSTIHGAAVTKEKNLDKILVYDNYQKVCLSDHLVSDLSLDSFKKNQFFKSLANQKYQLSFKKDKKGLSEQAAYKDYSLDLSKKITLSKESSLVSIKYQFEASAEISQKKLAVEFNLYIPSLDSSYYKVSDKMFSLKDDNFFNDCEKFDVVDQYRGFKVKFLLENCTILVYPLYSVSASEGGVEKNYQQLNVFFVKDLSDKGFKFSFEIKGSK